MCDRVFAEATARGCASAGGRAPELAERLTRFTAESHRSRSARPSRSGYGGRDLSRGSARSRSAERAGQIGTTCVNRRRRVAQDRREQRRLSSRPGTAARPWPSRRASRQARRRRTAASMLRPSICSGDMYGTVPKHDALARASDGLGVDSAPAAPSGSVDFREPEVEHFDAAVGRHHHVGRLQIAVDDALVMRGGERIGERPGQVEQLRDRHAIGGSCRSSDAPSTSSIVRKWAPCRRPARPNRS